MPADCSASCVVQVMVLLVVQDFTNDVLTGDHDWVNPSDELLASLREELDLDLRDAPDDSDDGIPRAGEGGPTRKCRPWHWLQEMRCAASSNASVWPATTWCSMCLQQRCLQLQCLTVVGVAQGM